MGKYVSLVLYIFIFGGMNIQKVYTCLKSEKVKGGQRQCIVLM